MKKYYCNKPCEIIHQDERESLIEIDTHLYHDEEWGVEPYNNRIIVDSKYITDKKIDFEKELRKIEEEHEKRLEERRIKEQNKIYEIEKQLKRWETKLNKYGDLKYIIDILDGRELFVFVRDFYNIEIKKIGELVDKSEHGYEKDKLSTIGIIRDTSQKEYFNSVFGFVICKYTDMSGTYKSLKICETEKEAIEYSINYMYKEKHWEYYIGFCDKYNIKIQEVENEKEKRKKQKEKDKKEEIIKLEKKLKGLKS